MTAHVDPLYLLKAQSDDASSAGPSSSQPGFAVNNPMLMREQSIKTNRRHKFVSALTRDDIDICTSSMDPLPDFEH